MKPWGILETTLWKQPDRWRQTDTLTTRPKPLSCSICRKVMFTNCTHSVVWCGPHHYIRLREYIGSIECTRMREAAAHICIIAKNFPEKADEKLGSHALDPAATWKQKQCICRLPTVVQLWHQTQRATLKAKRKEKRRLMWLKDNYDLCDAKSPCANLVRALGHDLIKS